MQVVGSGPVLANKRGIDPIIQDVTVGAVDLVRSTPDAPTFRGYWNRACTVVGDGTTEVFSILVSEGVHGTIE